MLSQFLTFFKSEMVLLFKVKLTIMIEDPRDVERRRLLGIDDENAPTRDDLADALVQVSSPLSCYVRVLPTASPFLP